MVGPFDKRNVFDLSHEHKLTCNMGMLIPCFNEEVLPGDTWKVNTDIAVRIAPMLAPIMHRVDVFTHFFFIPTRILQDDWEKFITGGPDGRDNTPVPVINSGSEGFAVGSLADYLGCPTGVANIDELAYPFRAYTMVYNEWYRNQNVQDPLPLSFGNGLDTITNTSLLRRNWEKDYFTSALPWPQRGPAVNLPLGTSAPVEIAGNSSSVKMTVGDPATGTYGNLSQVSDNGLVQGHKLMTVKSNEGNVGSVYFNTGWGNAGLRGNADLSTATAVTVNDMRQAFQVQRWMEKNARAGARYVESLMAHFGVRSSDGRLQRPEYLGGGRSPVVVSEVLQTSSTDSVSPQGNMSGHAFSAQRTHEFVRSFEEHGYILGIMSIMPRTAYQQGSPRMFNRRTRYDFAWPVFSHLGEQAVLNKEIYAQGTAADDQVFGYQNRYDEYRHRLSFVHGQFRSTLDYWHMGRIFGNLPKLNATFVAADPTKRINAVVDQKYDNCWVDIYHAVKAIRPLPKKGVPGFIDHD